VVDGAALLAEEVEIGGLAVNEAVRDERRSAGKRETLSLGKAGEEPGDLLLERAQQASCTPRNRARCSAHACRT